MYNAFTELERRRGELARIAENSARLAFAFASYTTTGIGRLAFPTAIVFDAVFIERPFMSYGYQFLLDDDDQIGDAWPRSVGCVWDWNQNAKDHYTGASVAVCVDVPSVITPTPAYPLEHHFTFIGMAMKDFPANLLDD